MQRRFMTEILKGYQVLNTQNAFLNLPKEDRDFLRDYKHHVEANADVIFRILYGNDHPKLREFFNWINSCADNRNWYLKNTNKIKLVPNGIEILGDVYDLEDVNPPESSDIIDKERWNRKDAEEFAKLVGKEIPDWVKVIKFLPKKDWHTFFTDVMGMSRLYLGSSCDTINSSKNVITFGSALGSSGRLRLVTIKK